MFSFVHRHRRNITLELTCKKVSVYLFVGLLFHAVLQNIALIRRRTALWWDEIGQFPGGNPRPSGLLEAPLTYGRRENQQEVDSNSKGPHWWETIGLFHCDKRLSHRGLWTMCRQGILLSLLYNDPFILSFLFQFIHKQNISSMLSVVTFRHITSHISQ